MLVFIQQILDFLSSEQACQFTAKANVIGKIVRWMLSFFFEFIIFFFGFIPDFDFIGGGNAF